MNVKRNLAQNSSTQATAAFRLRLGSASLACVSLLFLIGCSSPTPSYPITPQPGEDGATPAVGEVGGGQDASGRPTNVPPMGGDAYATERNITIPTVDPDAPYPPPLTETPVPAYPPPDEG